MITSRDSLVQAGMADVLEKILNSDLDTAQHQWFQERLRTVLASPSAKDLYMFYTLTGQHLGKRPVNLSGLEEHSISEYLRLHQMNLAEAGRICLLLKALDRHPEAYQKAVQKLIEIADGNELITFLKYLVFLPEPERYRHTATEALRTNIVPVFDAIALNNPYPRLYFNEQQWNQMYLKAAFLQRPLLEIEGVEERANRELSRIVSDYAHERWAASRAIDPHIWHTVGYAPGPDTLDDLRHLTEQGSDAEVKAAVLVAASSPDNALGALADAHPEILELIKNNTLNWNNLK